VIAVVTAVTTDPNAGGNDYWPTHGVWIAPVFFLTLGLAAFIYFAGRALRYVFSGE
jgi:hypothetical protein